LIKEKTYFFANAYSYLAVIGSFCLALKISLEFLFRDAGFAYWRISRQNERE